MFNNLRFTLEGFGAVDDPMLSFFAGWLFSDALGADTVQGDGVLERCVKVFHSCGSFPPSFKQTRGWFVFGVNVMQPWSERADMSYKFVLKTVP